jgi:hypothetical protein
MSELALPSMPRHSPDAMLAKRPTSAIGTQDGKEILLAREPEVDKFPVALRLFTRLAAHSTGWLVAGRQCCITASSSRGRQLSADPANP